MDGVAHDIALVYDERPNGYIVIVANMDNGDCKYMFLDGEWKGKMYTDRLDEVQKETVLGQTQGQPKSKDYTQECFWIQHGRAQPGEKGEIRQQAVTHGSRRLYLAREDICIPGFRRPANRHLAPGYFSNR